LNIINTFFEITIIKSFGKKEKKKEKNNFRHLLKNFIVTSKVIRRRQQKSIDSKGILRQSESVEAPNRLEVMGPISIQVSSAILQDQVTLFSFYFTYQI
jgi:hypothetical protein